MVRQAGCQPLSRRFNFTGVSECDTWDLMQKYSKNIISISETEGGKVIEKTKCLLPCSFMEYKVIIAKKIDTSNMLNHKSKYY